MPVPFEISFIRQAFRDTADQDYIAARTLYRVGLDLQFLWASLQAIEKYLKAILLYNGLSARGLGHEVTAAYRRVLSISDISFDFSEDLQPFLEYLEVYGQNRYLQHPYFTHGEELVQLDRSVWQIRRYCQYLRAEVTNRSGAKVNLLEAHLRSFQGKAFVDHPTRFRIFGGFLEGVIGDRHNPARPFLIWNNEYFGSPRRKRRVRSIWVRSVSVNPIHFLEPKVFSVLRGRVDFPRALLRHFDATTPNRRMKPIA